MIGGRRETNLANASLKLAVREGIHRELNTLLLLHIADVRLGNRQLDLHLRQILSDQEQGGRAETGGHGLTRIHAPGHHHATDRREDGRAIQIDLSALDSSLAGLDPGLSLEQSHIGLLILGLGDELRGEEFLGALGIEFGHGLTCGGIGQIRLGPGQRALVGGWIDVSQNIPFLHDGIKIDLHLGDGARDLGTHLDLADGGYAAIGAHALNHVGPHRCLGLELHGHWLLEAIATGDQQQECRQ